MTCFYRTEELVRLEHKLPAKAMLVVDDQRPHASLAQLDGCRQPGRAAANDQALRQDCLNRPGFQSTGNRRQGWLAIERLDVHAPSDRDHAGLDGKAVRNHCTLGALPVGAEDALRSTVLVMMAEDAHAVGE
jgi:hypothetical protein